MAVRLILLAVIAISAANGQGLLDQDSGPEDMHFPVVRALNDLLSKHLDNLYTLMMMKIKNAKVLSNDKSSKKMLDDAIRQKAGVVMEIIDYAGSRGLTPDVDDPQPYDIDNECDDVFGCWKLSLQMERDLYKVQADAYSSAGSHEDADAQAALVPLIQETLRSIRFEKAVIAKIESKVAKKQLQLSTKQPDLVGGPDTVYDPYE